MKIDFGISKRTSDKTSSLLKTFRSVRYSDPEYLNDPKYTMDEKSDVYSVGVLFWEISSGRIPFESESADGKLTLAIIQGKRETIIDDTPQKYSEIYTGIFIHSIYLIFVYLIYYN